MERQSAYEIVNHAEGDKVLATLWWDGKRIQSDNKKFLEGLKHQDHVIFTNSEAFLHKLPKMYRSGYMMARKAKK